MRVAVVLLLLFALIGCNRQPPAYESRYTEPSTAPPAAAQPVAFIGDSYVGGSGEGGMRDKGWPALVTTQLEQQGIHIRPDIGSAGGSGYVNRGPTDKVFADLIPEAVHPDDRLVVVFGSRNDRGIPTDTLATAVRDTLAGVKATAPNAALLVIGPTWFGDPTPAILEVRDTLRAQAQAVGAVFIDPITDGWFTGQAGLEGADGVHPNDAGHVYLAEKIGPLITQQLRR